MTLALTGWESNLILTLPLVAFVLIGLLLWEQMDRWIADALEREDDEALR